MVSVLCEDVYEKAKKEHKFILDTGADISVITEELANDLKLPEVGTIELCSLCGREKGKVQTVGLTMSLPDFTNCQKFFLIIVKAATGKCILGKDFLSQFDVIRKSPPPSALGVRMLILRVYKF